MVSGPTVGTSQRRSWAGRPAFTMTHPGPASLPARSITASVPSIASTATMFLSLTITVCPISMPASSLAALNPKAMSRCIRSSG